eukprot:g4301.t1
MDDDSAPARDFRSRRREQFKSGIDLQEERQKRRMQELFAENLGIYSSSPSSSPFQPSSRILNLSSPSMEIFPASVIAAANAGSNSSASGGSNGEQDLSGSAEQADDNMSADDGISELRPLPTPGTLTASQCVGWCKVASIPELAHALQVAATGSLLVEPRMLAAVAIETRQRLARDRDIPIRECVDAGMVPALVRLMVETDDQDLRFELSWSLTNIASGEGPETAAVVENGGLQAFLQVLRSDRALDARVCDQCVWAIGNVAGDGPRYRDLLLEHGAVPLLRDLYFTIPNLADWTAAKKRDCARNLMWTLGNLCRGTPKPVGGKVAAAFEVFCDAVFADGDEDLVYEALWGLNYLVTPGPGGGEVAGGGSSSSAALPGAPSRPPPEAASTSTTGGDYMGADPQNKESGRLYDAGQAREARAAIELFFERGQVNPYETARMLEQGDEEKTTPATNRTGRSAMVDVLLCHFFHSMRNRWVVTKILAAIVSCPGEAQGYNRYPYQRRHASASAAASTSGEAPLVSGTFTRLVLQTKQLFPAMLAFLKFPEGRRLEELMQNLKKQARLQSGSQRGAAAGRGGGSQANHELLAAAAIAEYEKLPGLASLFVDHAMGRKSAPRSTRRRSKNSQEPHPSTLTHIEDGFAFNMGAHGYTSEKKLAQHKRECAAFLCSVAGTRFVSEFWTASLNDPNANPGMQIVTGPLRKSPKGVDSVIAVPDAEVHPDIFLFQEEIRKNRSRSSSKQGAASDVAVNLHNHGAPRASGRVVDAVEEILADDSAEMNENMDRGGAAPAVRTVTPAPGTSNSVSRSISREQDGIDHAAHDETHTQPASPYDGVCVLRDVINGTLTASDAAQRECALALSHVLEAADLGQVHALVVEYGVVGAYCDLLQSPAATLDPLLIAFCVKTLETCFHLSVLHPALEQALNIAAERAARFASAIESWEAELREAYDRMNDTIINDTSFFANKTISTTPLKSLAHTRPSGFDSCSDEDHLQLQKDKGGAVDMVVPSTFGAAAQSAFHFGHQQQPMVDRTSGVLLDEDNVNMND